MEKDRDVRVVSMEKYRDVRVASYALLDTLKALEICGVRNPVITKIDNDLLIRWSVDDEPPYPKIKCHENPCGATVTPL